MKVVLVTAPAWYVGVPPFAVACLSAALRAKGHLVRGFDFNGEFHREQAPADQALWELGYRLHRDWNRPESLPPRIREGLDGRIPGWAERIADEEPDLVGFSIYSENLALSRRLAAAVKAIRPGTPIVFGGPFFPSRLPERGELAARSLGRHVAVGRGTGTREELVVRLGEDGKRVRLGIHFGAADGYLILCFPAAGQPLAAGDAICVTFAAGELNEDNLVCKLHALDADGRERQVLQHDHGTSVRAHVAGRPVTLEFPVARFTPGDGGTWPPAWPLRLSRVDLEFTPKNRPEAIRRYSLFGVGVRPASGAVTPPATFTAEAVAYDQPFALIEEPEATRVESRFIPAAFPFLRQRIRFPEGSAAAGFFVRIAPRPIAAGEGLAVIVAARSTLPDLLTCTLETVGAQGLRRFWAFAPHALPDAGTAEGAALVVMPFADFIDEAGRPLEPGAELQLAVLRTVSSGHPGEPRDIRWHGLWIGRVRPEPAAEIRFDDPALEACRARLAERLEDARPLWDGLGGARVAAAPPAAVDLFDPRDFYSELYVEVIRDLLASGDADLVALGEGEGALLDLCGTLAAGGDPGRLPGLVARGPRGPVYGGDRREPCRPADLPPADFRDFDPALTGKIPIAFSRGCASRCRFCRETRFWGTLRVRPARQVFDELLAHVRARLGRPPFEERVTFFLAESAFNGDPAMLRELAALILNTRVRHGGEMKPLGEHLLFEGMARVAPEMDDAFYALLQRAGFHLISFGVESGSDAVLAAMGKGITAAQAEAAIRSAARAGIAVMVNLMVGYPAESRADFRETLRFVRRIRPYVKRVGTGFPCIAPDMSALYEDPLRHGIRIENCDLMRWRSLDGRNHWDERLRRLRILQRTTRQLGLASLDMLDAGEA